MEASNVKQRNRSIKVYDKKTIFNIVANGISVLLTMYALVFTFEIFSGLMSWSRLFYPGIIEPFQTTGFLTALYLSTLLLSTIMRIVAVVVSLFVAIALNTLVVLNVLRVLGKGRGYTSSYWIIAAIMIAPFSGVITSLPLIFIITGIATIVYAVKHWQEYSLVGLGKRKKWILLMIFLPIVGCLIAIYKFRKDIKYLLIPRKWSKAKNKHETGTAHDTRRN